MNTVRCEFIQAGYGVINTALFIAPGLGIILHDLGGEYEDVLVHQSDTELCGIDRASRGSEDTHA
jgi:hypothetical protein